MTTSNVSALPEVVILPLVKGDDGIWEAMITEVRTSDDLETRPADALSAPTTASVRVLGELKQLEVFVVDDGEAVCRYEDAVA